MEFSSNRISFLKDKIRSVKFRNKILKTVNELKQLQDDLRNVEEKAVFLQRILSNSGNIMEDLPNVITKSILNTMNDRKEE